MRKSYAFVYVEWQDAEHDGGWSDVRDEADHVLTTIQSSGWLIHENRQRIVISGSIDKSTGNVGNKQYIPRRMITKFFKVRDKHGRS